MDFVGWTTHDIWESTGIRIELPAVMNDVVEWTAHGFWKRAGIGVELPAVMVDAGEGRTPPQHISDRRRLS